MLKAVRSIDQLQSTDRLRLWLLRILTNTWKDHLRKTANLSAGEHQEHVIDHRHTPIERVSSQQEDLQLALDAMNLLPAKQRAVLHLFAVEQLSLGEIAQILDMQPATARVNLFHARQSMKNKLPQLAKHNNDDVSEGAPS